MLTISWGGLRGSTRDIEERDINVTGDGKLTCSTTVTDDRAGRTLEPNELETRLMLHLCGTVADEYAKLMEKIPEEKVDIYRSKKLPKWQRRRRK